LGLKLQRAAASALKARGVDHVFGQAGTRGSAGRIASLYKRLGATDDGQVFRLQLAGV
jgi:thiamine pyrophosphate-dependent acetolactate synthase large subunit-like protein